MRCSRSSRGGCGRQSALLAYRVGPDVRNLLLVAGTVDTHPLCNAARKAAASEVQFQATDCEASLKVGLEGLRFLLGPAVNQPVIRIPAPRKVWVRPRHPEIERTLSMHRRRSPSCRPS